MLDLVLKFYSSRSSIHENGHIDSLDVGLDQYYNRNIPPQPTAAVGKPPPPSSKEGRRKDASPAFHNEHNGHVCRDSFHRDDHRQSNSHSLSSVGGLKTRRSVQSPPRKPSTIPRDKSPANQLEKHATLPRESSPHRHGHRGARHSESANSMPCSPPPYVHPKLSDKDCGCPCDCRSSFYTSQEVGLPGTVHQFFKTSP